MNSSEKKRLKELYKKRREIDSEIDRVYVDLIPRIKFKFSVTDHALVEYLEDINDSIPVSNIHEAKFRILSTVESFFDEHPNINLADLKGTAYKLRISGLIYVILNNKIITIYSD